MTARVIERCATAWWWVRGAGANLVVRINSLILIGMTGASVLVGIDLVALAVLAPVATALILAASVVWGLIVVRRRQTRRVTSEDSRESSSDR